MAISNTQLSEIISARQTIESLLCDMTGDVNSYLSLFSLSAEVFIDVCKRIVAAPDVQSRAIALLKALDWLTCTNPCQALGLAFALQSFWASRVKEDGPNSKNKGLLFPNSALILQSVAFSLIGIGAFEELRALSEELLPELRQLRMPLTVETFSVTLAEAALRLGQVNEARALLPDREIIQRAAAEQSARGAMVPEGPTLVRRDNLALELGFLETAAIAETRPFSERSAIILAEIIEAVRSLLERSGKNPAEIEDAVTKLEMLKNRPSSKGVPEMSRVIEMLAVLEEIVAPLAPGLALRADRLRTATEGLKPEERGDSEEALEEICRLKNEELAAKDLDGWLSYTWLESLVLERKGRPEEALAALESISAVRDTLAGGATSARERAGLSSSFGDLAPRTAMLRLRTGAGIEAVFKDIESGKCRWLADTPNGEVPCLSSFREQTAADHIHYLTFAVGSDLSVAVFVPASGDPLAAEIPIGRDDIAQTAYDMTGRRDFSADLTANLAERLGRLTAWLPAPTVGGVIQPGDVLIVAPHGPLHSIPLHAMPVSDGLPLAPRLAVVRTHGAALVMRTVARNTPPPLTALAVCSLAANETQRVRRAASFDSVVRDLENVATCEVLHGLDADFTNVQTYLKPSQVIHLFAHGDAITNSPYTRSGLLLPSGGRLPMRGRASFYTDHLVSPERIAKTNFNNALVGSHITLQACVSGHAQSNLRGDAIGLEWSLLLSEAASVLATHWHIDFATSAEFCGNFYRSWLGLGLTRAEAWRRSAEQLIGAGDANSWAAFSLTGDWR